MMVEVESGCYGVPWPLRAIQEEDSNLDCIVYTGDDASPQSLIARAFGGFGVKLLRSPQALSALVWRAITRARKLPPDQGTHCQLIVENRTRLQPPLSPHYFGNCTQRATSTSTAAQLLSHDLGWAAWLVHQSVAAQTDVAVRRTLDAWVKAPVVFRPSKFERWNVVMTASPRFNIYGNDFGWGRPVAVRSGCGNKFDGRVTSYPGHEGAGSVDLEICPLPEFMSALELDDEFMNVVSGSMVL